jgi:hypothetical protein
MNRREFCKLSSLAWLAKVNRVGPDVRSDEAIVRPKEYSGALRNPLKGLRSGDINSATSHPYASLAKAYIKWNDIENQASDGVERIAAFCNEQWKDVHLSNTKVIPRVYLEWPNRGQYWPADMNRGDYSSPQFQHRVVRLIEKLGQAWNHDPRVAYVETGLIGLWGEQHDPSPSAELQKLVGDAYAASFPDKLLMNRYPYEFVDYKFGIYWDSFGHREEAPRHIPLLKSPRLVDRWMIAPMGGETAFDWGTPLGRNPTDAVVNNCDAIVALIRGLHWNHLGWLSDYDFKNPAAVKNAARIQKALGYRFVIDEVRCPAFAKTGVEFRVSFRVRNTGSSPFYYRWPIELSLLNPSTRKPAWKATFQGVDLRKWLPNSRQYEEMGTFHLDADIQPGTYVACLAILDPAGNEPGARFAIVNYYNGGRHPVRSVGVGAPPTASMRMDFDDPARDESLRYSLSSS